MATSKTGPPDTSGAPPELPEEKPQRFQFSLLQLVAFMTVSAIVAAGVRQLGLYVEALPDRQQIGLVNVTVYGLAFGGLMYFFLRVPFLAVGAGRFRDRWRTIQRHRRELEAWGEARKREQAAQSESADSQRPE
jgi:hypothetical protein